MSACRVYVCAAGMVALGSLLLGAGLVHAATNAAAWTVAWAWGIIGETLR